MTRSGGRRKAQNYPFCLPTESEAECIARDRSWSEYCFDQGAGNRQREVEGTLGRVRRSHRVARPPQNQAVG